MVISYITGQLITVACQTLIHIFKSHTLKCKLELNVKHNLNYFLYVKYQCEYTYYCSI